MPIGTGWAEHSWLGRGLPQQDQVWVEARRRFRLSHAQVQMARELGMNPKKLGKLANDRQEPWKEPLPQFIQSLYVKRFGRERPAVVLAGEERAGQQDAREAMRRSVKARNREAAADE